MNQTAFIIALTAVAFVIGRSIRDLLRKRPVREKKARRKILNRLFATISLILVVGLFFAVAIIGGVIVFFEDIETVDLILMIVILGFSAYLSYEIVRYLKRD